MDYTKQSPVILSLCPGMLGLERGFERAGKRLNWQPHRTAAYVEIEAFIVANLVSQMEQGLLAPTPVHSNIKTFDGKPFRGKIHGILGGYPCQPFSLAGERKGEDDPRHLWPFISGIIKAIEPVFCFFENVSGHLSLGYGEVYRSLRDMGYSVEAGIFTAEEVGAPHQRERLFILAIKLGNTNNFAKESRGEGGELCGTGDFNSLKKGEWGEKRIPVIGGSDKLHGEDELADSSITGCEKSGLGRFGKLQEKEGLGIHNRLEQSSDGIEELGISESTKLPRTEGADERGEYISNDRSEVRDSIRPTSEVNDELAHAHAHGHLLGESKLDTTEGRIDALCDITSSGGENLADTEITRPYGEDTKGDTSTWGCNSEYDRMVGEKRWPARPGEQQYEWEEPRIESKLGFTAHGHNFREDLLRMAGNGVVEQTAEVGFLTLLEKHYGRY